MGRLGRWATILVVAGWLGGCTGYMDGTILDQDFWSGGRFAPDNKGADLGLAELSRGNYGEAENHFNSALKANPKDVHAMLGLAVLYQHTGRENRSRGMYRAILRLQPPESEQSVVWNNFSTRPISEIASVNLGVLEKGSGITFNPPGLGQTPPPPAPVAGSPYQPRLQFKAVNQAAPGAALPPPAPMFADADANIAARFKALNILRQQGLMTLAEHKVRRRANIGALLPLTSPPPAAGLDRPVPAVEQVSGRLRAIGRALEMRALSVEQHRAERTMILDGLMPSAPVVVDNPGAPPKGLMEAADAVRRLEQIRKVGLITSDEYSKERAAIELAMQPAPPKMAETDSEKAAAKSMNGRNGVHLASYRSRKAANRGWSQLRRAHKETLGDLDSEVTEVDLGAGKGIYFRLKAGPLKNQAAAGDLCRKLKDRRQYCQPTIMGNS